MFRRQTTVAACLVILLAGAAQASLQSTPGLSTITIYEVTGSPIPWNYAPNATQLLNQIGGSLLSATADFYGLTNEPYDVFYSDANGNLDVNGDYLTIECEFPGTASGGGGNIAEVYLNLVDGTAQCACAVVSSYTYGGNAIPASVSNAADCDLGTLTTLGNTVGAPERLRVTLDFFCPTATQPSTWGNVKRLFE
jgi:hypothetical protein